MHKIAFVACLAWLASLVTRPASAHTVNYHVERGSAIVVRVFYSDREVADYSAYEVFGPADDMPFQKGRTDRRGYLSFVPDRAGKWLVKVQGESEHGFHGASIEVTVDQASDVQHFEQPLVATHTRLIVGISVILGIFGLLSLRARRRQGGDA